MADFLKGNVTFGVNAVDNASATLGKVKGNVDKLDSSVDEVDKSTKQTKKSFDILGAVKLTTLINSVIGLERVMADAIKNAGSFSYEIDRLQAVSGATDKEIDNLSRQILTLGADTILTNSEVAQGAVEMAKLGYDAEELEKSLDGVVTASVATGTNMADMGKTIAITQSQFGLLADTSEEVGDIITTAVNSSALNVESFSESMKYAGTAANTMGMGVEETTALLMVFADAGISGSQAGTGLRYVLQELSNPTSTQAEILEELGVATYDAEGNFRGLSAILTDYASATADSTQKEKSFYAEKLAGTRASTLLKLATEDNVEALAEYEEALNSSAGASKTASEIMMSNLKAQLESVLGSIESLVTTILSYFEPALLVLIGALIKVINTTREVVIAIFEFIDSAIEFVKNNEILKNSLLFIVAVIGTYILITQTIIGVTKIWNTVQTITTTLTELLDKAQSGLNSTLMFYIIVIGLVLVGIYILIENTVGLEAVVNFMREAWEKVSAFWTDTLLPVLQVLFSIFLEKIVPVLVILGGVIIQYLIPVFVGFVNFIVEEVVPALKQLVDYFIENIWPSLKIFIKLMLVLTAVFIAFAMKILVQIVFPALAMLVTALTPIIPVVIELAKIFINVITILLQLASTILSILLPIINTLIMFFITNVVPIISQVIDIFSKFWGVVNAIASLILGVLLDVLGKLLSIITKLTSAIRDQFIKILDKLKEILEPIIDVMETLWGVMEKILGGIGSLVGSIGGFFSKLNPFSGNAFELVETRNINRSVGGVIDVATMNGLGNIQARMLGLGGSNETTSYNDTRTYEIIVNNTQEAQEIIDANAEWREIQARKRR